jgi:excisionase family DNA binding protein
MEGTLATLERRREPWKVKELAKALNVSGSHIYRQAERGKLLSVNFGYAIRFEPKDVVDWYKAKKR